MGLLNGISSIHHYPQELVDSFKLLHSSIWATFLVLLFLFEFRSIKHYRSFFMSTSEKKTVLWGGLTLFACLYGFLCWRWGPESLFLSMEYALSIVLCFISPVNAVAFFVFALITRQWEFTFGNLVFEMPQDLGILLGLSFILSKVIKKEFSIQYNKSFNSFWPFLIILLFGCLKVPDSFGAFKESTVFYSKVLLIFFVALDSIKTNEELNRIKIALCLGIFQKVFMTLLIFWHKQSILTFSSGFMRLSGFGALGDPNDLAGLAILALPLGFGLIKGVKVARFENVIAWCYGIFLCYFIWETRSRGALIALLLCGGLIFLKRIEKKFKLVLIPAILVGGYFALSGSLGRSDSDLKGSIENRLNYWHTGVRMVSRHPLLGVGYNQYPELFEKYAPSLKGETGKRTAHSTWILALAETGVVGFILFMLLFYRAWNFSYSQRGLDPYLFYSLSGYFVTLSFLSQNYLFYPYLALTIAFVSNQVKSRQRVETNDPHHEKNIHSSEFQGKTEDAA